MLELVLFQFEPRMVSFLSLLRCVVSILERAIGSRVIWDVRSGSLEFRWSRYLRKAGEERRCSAARCGESESLSWKEVKFCMTCHGSEPLKDKHLLLWWRKSEEPSRLIISSPSTSTYQRHCYSSAIITISKRTKATLALAHLVQEATATTQSNIDQATSLSPAAT